MWHTILWCAGCFAIGSLIAIISYMLGRDAAQSEEDQKRNAKFPD